MILITGAAGFIGSALTDTLLKLGYPVRLLIDPSRHHTALPPTEIAISGTNDPRNLRAALKNVDTIFHLIGTDARGIHADYLNVDIPSARSIAEVAAQMHVRRIITLSHIGTSPTSVHPHLKAKALIESAIIKSGTPYTIIRSSPIYGENDHFTTRFAQFIRKWKSPLLIPSGDPVRVQPLWIQDLITTLLLVMENPAYANQIIEIGGIETFTFNDILELVMTTINKRKRTLSLPPYIIRPIYVGTEQYKPKLPSMYFWLNYFASDHLAPLDILPRQFGLMPTRLTRNIDYLKALK